MCLISRSRVSIVYSLYKKNFNIVKERFPLPQPFKGKGTAQFWNKKIYCYTILI